MLVLGLKMPSIEIVLEFFFSGDYNTDFFKQFTLVLNALDNKGNYFIHKNMLAITLYL